MNCSTNSEKTPSRFHRASKTQTYEKFGLTLTVTTVLESREHYVHKVTTAEGVVLDLKNEEVLKQLETGEIHPIIDWVPTGDLTLNTYAESTTLQDDEDCTEPRPVEVFSTPDGPLLGIVLNQDNGYFRILDPCIVVYDGKRVDYRPIFNVSRYLDLHVSAIRSRQTPCEVILAGYPGFIVQNRMFRYQLKPAITSNPPLTNDAI